jgi:hypothetical protein
MTDKSTQQQLLDARGRLIELLESHCEQLRLGYDKMQQQLRDEMGKDAIIEQLEELAEQRRLDYMNQCKELAARRESDKHIDGAPWRFACWLMFKDLWPFSIWYHRFDR